MYVNSSILEGIRFETKSKYTIIILCLLHFIVDLPCLKKMGSNGVILKKDLDVHTTEIGNVKTFTVKSKVPEEFTLVGYLITPGTVSEIKSTEFGKDGKQIGETKITPVTDSAKSTLVLISTQKPADHVVIELTSSNDKSTTADLESIVACMTLAG